MGFRDIAVYGAYGHTGRFVVAELLARGWTPVLSGRDAGKLERLAALHGGVDVRQASVDDAGSMQRALAGVAAAINCAGPFALTADPAIEAALRARIPYIDVGAEIEVASTTFARYRDAARDAGVALVPSMAFFGGLGDLLATAAMGDWTSADGLSIAYGLDSWNPTDGTRATSAVSGRRRNGRHFVFLKNGLELRSGDAPRSQWPFPAPRGLTPVVGEFTMADTVIIAQHLRVEEIGSFMTEAAVRDVTKTDYSKPVPVDDRGRSSQTFLVDVVARKDGETRRAIARGRDIYAVSAPLAVEAMERILAAPPPGGGVFAAGELFDPRDFLSALSPDLSVEFAGERSSKDLVSSNVAHEL